MMNGSARLPHLAVPFTIVGAAAGWLTATFFRNPALGRMQSAPPLGVAAIAAVMAAAAGFLITRAVRGDHARYQIDEGSEPPRATHDRWEHHAGVVLLAGVLTASLAAGVFDAYIRARLAAVGGLACAAAFVPVCLAVVAAARRAQRARMGSLVAESDRRAVWGILAMTLSVATLWGLPIWPAAEAGAPVNPWPAAILLGCAALAIAIIAALDASALRRARLALSRDLTARDGGETGAEDTRIPRVDLGLGSDVAAEIQRPNAAYRGRDRAVALVIGSPDRALSALRRAVARGVAGVVLALGIAALHGVATSSRVQLAYDDALCDAFDFKACARVAAAVQAKSPMRALDLYSRACSLESTGSCRSAATMLDAWANGEERPNAIWHATPNALRAHANQLYQRGCRYGDGEACRMTAR